MECGTSRPASCGREAGERPPSLSNSHRSAPLAINKQSVTVLFGENVPNKDSQRAPPMAGPSREQQRRRAGHRNGKAAPTCVRHVEEFGPCFGLPRPGGVCETGRHPADFWVAPPASHDGEGKHGIRSRPPWNRSRCGSDWPCGSGRGSGSERPHRARTLWAVEDEDTPAGSFFNTPRLPPKELRLAQALRRRVRGPVKTMSCTSRFH
ncbi:hypothetical protein DPEC_G00270440 [Dallia pectoralis]|uniref:Uncharacterized protein n=1 Tax=Dallia pectoralis TaxID=75939 RepID=A0ACC2FPA7_DALPE|nr:hypothetical protein DPEC_G00270440 [Dallia pectoralis]